MRWPAPFVSACALVAACSIFGSEEQDAVVPPPTDGGIDAATVIAAHGSVGVLGPAVTLVEREAEPVTVATDAAAIYWGNLGDGVVRRRGKTDGVVTTLWTSKAISYVVADRSFVYALAASGGGSCAFLHKLKSGQGDLGSEANAGCFLQRLAIDDQHLIVSELPGTTSARVLERDKVSGTMIVHVEPSPHRPDAVATDGVTLTWSRSDDTTIMQAPKGSGDAPAQLFAKSPAAIADIAVDPLAAAGTPSVYWITGAGQVLALAKSTPVGEPRVLATGQLGPGRIAIDAEWVYWTNSAGGTVARVRKAGGPVETLATGLGAPFGIAVDDDGVFVAAREGRIVQMPATVR